MKTVAFAPFVLNVVWHVCNAAEYSSLNRILKGSFFDSFSAPTIQVDRCRGDAVYDNANGFDIPVVTCDFNGPKNYYSTAEIRVGNCDDFLDPAGGEFSLSGKISTTFYPEVTLEERRSIKFSKEFCARSDSFSDIDGSGNLKSISSTKVNLIISFTVESVYGHDYLMDVESTSVKANNPLSVVLGSLGTCFLAIVLVSLKKIHNEEKEKAADFNNKTRESCEVEIA